MPSLRSMAVGWLANLVSCSTGYINFPEASPVNGRPVRFEPCAPGASPMTSTRARGSPKPATGLPQYSQLRYARRFTRATSWRYATSLGQRVQASTSRFRIVSQDTRVLHHTGLCCSDPAHYFSNSGSGPITYDERPATVWPFDAAPPKSLHSRLTACKRGGLVASICRRTRSASRKGQRESHRNARPKEQERRQSRGLGRNPRRRSHSRNGNYYPEISEGGPASRFPHRPCARLHHSAALQGRPEKRCGRSPCAPLFPQRDGKTGNDPGIAAPRHRSSYSGRRALALQSQ